MESQITTMLVQKVERLRNFLTESSVQDIHSSFPRIVDEIFQQQRSESAWCLHLRHRSSYSSYVDVFANTNHFNLVVEFLAPGGVFMKCVLEQLCAPQFAFRYDFPFDQLTKQTQWDITQLSHQVSSTIQNSFWAQKIHASNGYCLKLNALELYLFKFFSYLTQLSPAGTNSEEVPVDNAYNELFLRYLRYFLFQDPATCGHLLNFSVHVAFDARSVFTKMASYPGVVATSPTRGCSHWMSRHGPDYSELFWPTNTFLQALFEFWVRGCLLPETATGDLSLMLETSADPGTSRRLLAMQVELLPSLTMVQALRVFVKFMTYFLFNKCPSVPITSPEAEEVVNHLRQWPEVSLHAQFNQHFVEFFAACLPHWPRDFTFASLLELWLTLIQPWRYTSQPLEHTNQSPFADPSVENGVANGHTRQEEETGLKKAEEPFWQRFVCENLDELVLVNLVTVLQRLNQLDLQSPRNVRMAYRLAKVFRQPHYQPLLFPRLPINSSTAPFDKVAPPRIASLASNNLLSVCFVEVEQLLHAVLLAYIKELLSRNELNLPDESHSKSRQSVHSPSPASSSFLSSTWKALASFFDASNEMTQNYEAETLRQSMPLYLNETVRFLSSAFHIEGYWDVIQRIKCKTITIQELIDRELLDSEVLSSNMANDTISPDDTLPETEYRLQPGESITDSSLSLTDLGRYQMINGLRRWPISKLKGHGDPFSTTPYPGENALLLWICLALSNWINAKFSTTLLMLCAQPNIIGSVSRYLLIRPVQRTSYAPVNRSHQPTPWEPERPRVNLRCFAFLPYYVWAAVLYVVYWLQNALFGCLSPITFLGVVAVLLGTLALLRRC